MVFGVWYLVLFASMIFTCACVAHVISAPLISIIWSPGWRRPSLATRPSGNTWKRRKCADLCPKSWRKLRPLGRRHIEEGYRSLQRSWCQETSCKVFLFSIFSILSICIICSISLISNVRKILYELQILTIWHQREVAICNLWSKAISFRPWFLEALEQELSSMVKLPSLSHPPQLLTRSSVSVSWCWLKLWD